ncbi:MAG TPA: metallophosphoesterase [Myxococcota bacterium]|jgi:bis(5'-nucleosyl)-tetraphosphatase (symmetrical)
MQPIFVGDVQGCSEELAELVARARAAYGEGFELWLVGDLINRGPGNLAVLREVRALVDAGRARCVLGNHEIGLLLTAAGLRERKPLDSFVDVLGAPDAGDWLSWLRKRPLLETGQLGGQRFAMVHASVHPDWSLAELERRARRVEARLAAEDPREAAALLAADPGRDPDRDLLGRLTQARSVTRAGGWSSELPGGELEPWHQRWSARGHDYCVVYGHWALQGLHVEPRLRGLDTGCVHHGRGREGALTAWIPDPSQPAPFDVPDGRFWHIPARRMYYQAP